MKEIHRNPVLLVLVALLLASAVAALGAQSTPSNSQLSRGTQLGRDPGRPMITVCPVGQPCQFVGVVDPGGLAAGPVILDSGYFSVCTPGACGVPAPFAITPAFLGGTAVAAGAAGAGGVGATAAVGAIAGVVGGVVGGTLSTGGGDNPVQTGSQ